MNKVSYRVVLKDDVKLTNIYTNSGDFPQGTGRQTLYL